MKKMLFFLLVFFPSLVIWAQSPSAQEIIRRMQGNEVHDSAYAQGRMEITDRFGTRVSTYKSWSKGEHHSLIEFTSPEEMGQKVLRTEDAIFLYFPDATQILRIQGSALRDGLLGSDLSYEDMTGGRNLLEQYELTFLGEETMGDHQVYQIQMVAKDSKVPYPKQILWIDTQLYVSRKAQRFSLSDRLLKEVEVLEITTQGGKNFPTKIRLRDALKTGTQTLLEISKLEINVPINDNFFSLEELSW